MPGSRSFNFELGIEPGAGASFSTIKIDNLSGILGATSGIVYAVPVDGVIGTINQVSVANGTSTILGSTNVVLSLPQDIHTGASPTFTGLTLSGLTLGSVIFVGTGGVISQDNANLFWDDTNDRLGIGTAIPSYKFELLDTSTATRGLSITKTNDSTVGTTTALTMSYTRTMLSSVSRQGVSNNSICVVDQNGFNNTSGIAVVAYQGNFGAIGTSGTVTGVIGFRSVPSISGGGTITSIYGFYASDASNTASTITNQYGLYLESMTSSATNYSIYSAGGQSVHAGNVRIGSTTAPTVTLDVTGNAQIAGYVGFSCSDNVIRANYSAIGNGRSATFYEHQGSGNQVGAWYATVGVDIAAAGATNPTFSRINAAIAPTILRLNASAIEFYGDATAATGTFTPTKRFSVSRSGGGSFLKESTFTYTNATAIGNTSGGCQIDFPTGTNDNSVALTFGGANAGAPVTSASAGIYVQSSAMFGSKMHLGVCASFANGPIPLISLMPSQRVGVHNVNPSVAFDVNGAALFSSTVGVTGVGTFSSATDSSSSITGSLITSGGLGVAKKAYIGTDLNVAGELQGARIILPAGFAGDRDDFATDACGHIMSAVKGYVFSRSGSFIGLSGWISVTAIATTGTNVTLEVKKNGLNIFTIALGTISSTGTTEFSGTQARGIDTFVAGDNLTLNVNFGTNFEVTIGSLTALMDFQLDA